MMPSGRDFQLPSSDRDFEDRRSERPERGFTPAAESTPEGLIARLERLAANLKRCASCGQTYTHTPIRNIEAPFPDEREFCSVGCLEAIR